ncbi:hypothetical protein Enr13x_44310 [Stieleria neptunia]|uniref:Uncharacterized protein n=1 Tax=Stieleria neptunia TaxID=2527979 RepID=A0A518HUN3_9BACT|nr:hypothetical protein [Stieleria neptunia]QDV44565.1 hypothetical protein Enr13x_44310 [Stieleria neptunia]
MMTHQYVHCPSGHKLKASPRLFGQTHPCPKCGEKVLIPAEIPPPHPLLQVAAPKKSVSDSSLMRVLGSVDAFPPPPQIEEPTLRPCPRCECSISIRTTVCQHCQCYVGKMPNFLRRMTQFRKE